MRPVAFALSLSFFIGCPKPGVNTTPEPATPTVTEVLDDRSVPVHIRINDAVDLMERGGEDKLARARTILEGVVDQEPNNAIGHLNLGIVQQRQGDLAEARISYQRATDADANNGDAWLYLGQVQLASDRNDLGLASLRSGVRRSPEHNGLRAALVQALRENGQLSDAIAEAKAALKFNSNNLALYNNLGLAYYDQGDLELAKFVFRKGIDGVPGGSSDAWLHTNLGRIYLQEGDTASARYYLEKAVEYDDTSIPALVYLGQLYMDDRNYPDAIPLLEKAHAADPSNHGVMMNLGVAYRGVERFDDAARMYGMALAEDPEDPAPQFNLAILYGDYQKDYERAIELLRRYVDASGDESAAASEYIADFEREEGRAARRRQAEEDARRREEERQRREELLAEEAAREAEGGGDAPPEAPEGSEPEETTP